MLTSCLCRLIRNNNRAVTGLVKTGLLAVVKQITYPISLKSLPKLDRRQNQPSR